MLLQINPAKITPHAEYFNRGTAKSQRIEAAEQKRAEQKALESLPNFGSFGFANYFAKPCKKQRILRTLQKTKWP